MQGMLLRSGIRLLRRVVITVVGVAILAVGVVLLAAPGPGVLVIALGLFTLSIEYEWAQRRLETVRQKAADLADMAVSNPWSTAGSVLAALGLVAAGILLGVVERLPFSSWWTGGSLIAGGTIALATILVSLEQARRARRAGVPTPAEELRAEHEERRERRESEDVMPAPRTAVDVPEGSQGGPR
jgi:uncharacterized protein (TIGR02611 family)